MYPLVDINATAGKWCSKERFYFKGSDLDYLLKMDSLPGTIVSIS